MFVEGGVVWVVFVVVRFGGCFMVGLMVVGGMWRWFVYWELF